MRTPLPRLHGLLCAIAPALAVPSPGAGTTLPDAAREALAATLTSQCEHHRTRLLRSPATSGGVLPAGHELRVQLTGPGSRRRQSVRVDVLDGETLHHRATVVFAVSCWRTAYRTLREIPRGEALSQTNTEPWRVNTTGWRISRPPLSGVAGLAARRTLPAGLLLGAADTMPVPLVRRHDRVWLQAVSGAVAVAVPGRALADAGPGESVLVRPLQGTGPVRARVTGAGRLEAGR